MDPKMKGVRERPPGPAAPPKPVPGGPEGMTDLIVVVVVGLLVVLTAVVVVTRDVVVRCTVVVVPVPPTVVVVAGLVVVVDALDLTVVVVDAAGVIVVVAPDVVVVGDDETAVVVVAPVTAAHVGAVMTLSSRVTAPFRANTRPLTFAPVSKVIEVRAKIEPLKRLVVPRVAELPTCQKTWQAWAPFSRTT